MSPLSVCLSVCMEHLACQWMDFHEIYYSSIFRKYVEKIQVLLKYDRNNGHFSWRPMHLCYLADFMLEWEFFQRKFIEKIKMNILFSIFFFRKSCRLWDNVEKFYRSGQTTDDNIIRLMLFAFWITRATNTYSEHVIHILFHNNDGYENAHQCYIMRTSSLLYDTVYGVFYNPSSVRLTENVSFIAYKACISRTVRLQLPCWGQR
jgi:hypothetical protein